MDIVYQYYNEIVLAFADYEVDFREGIITIQVPDDRKPFEVVCEKISSQINRIADTLEARDKEVRIRVNRTGEVKDFTFESE